MEKIRKELSGKNDEVKAEILYTRDDLRKITGIYNPEKD
jgi:hypothetical protein